jgi:hypothetical protein
LAVPPCLIEHFSTNHVYGLSPHMLEGQQQMFSKYRTVILVLSILLLVYALHLFPTSSIHNVSAPLTDPYVEVFWDRNRTQRVSSIDWGTLAPRMTKTVSIYVQNKSNETRILILIPPAQSSNLSFELSDPTTNTRSKVSTFQPGKNGQLA